MATIILLSDNNNDANFVMKIAQDCGARVRLLTDVYNAMKEAESTPDLIAFFVDTQPKNRLAIFETALGGHINKNIVHGFADTRDLNELDAFLESPVVGSFLIRKFGIVEQDAAHYARIVKATVTDMPFGLATFLKPNTEIQTVQLTESGQKGFASSAVVMYLQELGCTERIALSVAGAVDELLMNAIFDAPVDEDGQQLHDKTSRNSDILLPAIDMQIGCEGDYIGVSVVDRVGSLNRSNVLRYTAKSYNFQQGVRSAEFGGAGLGLSLILRSGGSLLFVTDPGKRTDVTVFFRRTEKLKDLKSQFQFVSSKVCG